MKRPRKATPSQTDEVAAAFKGIEFEGPSGKVKLAIGDGHQGVSETAYGTYRFNKEKNEPEIVDIMRFPPSA